MEREKMLWREKSELNKIDGLILKIILIIILDRY